MTCRIWTTMLSILVTVALLAPWTPAAEDAEDTIPLISELRKKDGAAEGTTQEEEKEVFPRTLTAREASLEAVDLLPAGAIAYAEALDGAGLTRDWRRTPVARLLAEKEVQRFLDENPLGFEALLQDLPQEYSASGLAELGEAGARILDSFMEIEGRISLVAYPGLADGPPRLLALVNIGHERRPHYERLQELLGAILEGNAKLTLQAGDHHDDYVDVLRPTGAGAQGPMLVVGFVRNFLVLGTDRRFALDLQTRAAGGGEGGSLSSGEAYTDLATKTPADSQVRGFLDLATLTANLANSKLANARSYAEFATDLARRGAVYYDLRIRDGGAIEENITIPIVAGQDTSSLAARLNMIGEKNAELGPGGLASPRVLPYQPAAFLALRVRPVAFTSLMQEERVFGASAMADELARLLPKEMRDIFAALAPRADALLEGELGIAVTLNAAVNNGLEWVLVLPLLDPVGARTALAPVGETFELAGIAVQSGDGELTGEGPAWAIFEKSPTAFRNLEASYLVIASSGPGLRATLDQTIGGGATLGNNKDFQQQVGRLSGQRLALAYENLPQLVQTGYPANLRMYIQSLYPQTGALVGTPSLRTLRPHLQGIAAAVSITPGGEMRITYRSPMGVAPVQVLQFAAQIPLWLRRREEAALLQARRDLGNLSLALQEYATQHGRFPMSLEERDTLGQIDRLLPEELNVRELLTNPAALLRLGSIEEARRQSYVYVPGLLPSDLPERVLLYTAEPWHYHYRDPNLMETYEACRLVLRLDGTIKAYSEEAFQRQVLPRIERRN